MHVTRKIYTESISINFFCESGKDNHNHHVNTRQSQDKNLSIDVVSIQVGAFLNEASQAKEGIEPSVFPQNLPVYTGHYHKPHVVKGTQIEYVGSPYQVSAGESGQIKHFLLLDKSWQVTVVAV